MKHFYIISNAGKDHDLVITRQICAFIESHGRQCSISELNAEGHLITQRIPEGIDCVIVVGGDGTLIRAARELAHVDIPFLGINLGTLGYLTEVEVDDFRTALERVFAGDYQIEERMMVEGHVSSDESYVNTALNDIVIARDGFLRIVYYDLFVNDVLLNRYRADGIIIATPTGSTGYNLSAGGPIVQPTNDVIVITPICSHAFDSSSVVLSARDSISVRIVSDRYGQNSHAAVSFDGADMVPLALGDSVMVKASKEVTKMIKLNQESFMNTIRSKMNQ